jgi:hypothetical protein
MRKEHPACLVGGAPPTHYIVGMDGLEGFFALACPAHLACGPELRNRAVYPLEFTTDAGERARARREFERRRP